MQPENRPEPKWPKYAPTNESLVLNDLSGNDRVTIEQLEQGGVRLSWSAADTNEAVVFYRVFSNQQAIPYEPDTGDWSDWTDGTTTLIDPRELYSGARHYSVWCHQGATPDAAINSTPRPVATGSLVAAVENMEVWEAGGAVKGRWHPVDDPLEVKVVRFAKGPGGVGLATQRVIGHDSKNRNGFTDPNPPRGTKATYYARVQFQAAYWIDQSERKSAEIEVSAALESVELVVSKRLGEGAKPLVDISWTKPQMGEVIVYATDKAPPSDLMEKISDVTAFRRVEAFSDVEALPDPPDGPDQGQQMRINGVEWPVEGERLWLTPLTLGRDGELRIGKTAYLSHVEPVKNVQLSERLSCLRLTFDWPSGADEVRAVLAPPDTEKVNPSDPSARKISLATYNETGGERVPWHEVRGEPKRIFVFSGDFDNLSFRATAPYVIDYPGLRRVGYSVVWHPQPSDASYKATVEVWSDKTTQSISFALVHRSARLPLDYQDGTRCAGSPARPTQPTVSTDGLSLPSGSIGPKSNQRSAWVFMVPQATGYVRLFSLPDRTDRLPPVALIDPPLEQLRVGKKGNEQ